MGDTIGVLCALPRELGGLRDFTARTEEHAGLVVHEMELDGARVLACVTGIGKVAAARGASVLIARGTRRALLVVGTCGGLRGPLAPGTFVHCTRAVQVDLAVRDGRESDSDVELRSAWRAVAPGVEALFLTADRPVLSIWRRFWTVRAFAGACVADMETAAVASVARAAKVPWAALRAVTDRADHAGRASFALHYETQAGRAADTVCALLRRLGSS